MRARTAALVIGLLALAGCGATPQQQGAAPAPVQVAEQQQTSVPVPEHLAWSATTLDGKVFDGASVAGKPVLLWFWAPWCATCAGQSQSVVDLPDKFKGRLAVVGVAGMGDAGAMKTFVDEFGVGNFPQVNDQSGEIWKRFRITEQSWYVLLRADGTMVHRGWLDDLQLTEKTTQLVG